MKYFDAHCHIQFDMFDEDRTAVIEAMRGEEIGGIVVGVDRDSSEQAINLVQAHKHLFAGVGLHPNYTQGEEFHFGEYKKLSENSKVVTIGECGLDYFRPEDVAGTKKLQQEVFQKHIQLAVETGKPLMIHARPSKGTMDAYTDLIELLTAAKREHGDLLTGNVHFFVGSVIESRELFHINFTTSYTAVLTFTHDYDEVVRFAPLTHLLTETDSPYVAPAPNRGKRNDPRSIPAIICAIAAIRGEDEDVVRLQILENAKNLFKI